MKILKTFKAIADETRLRIIHVFLYGSFNVNEVFFIVGGKQSNISHHLKILSDCELLIAKKIGAEVYYRLNENKEFDCLLEMIKGSKSDFDFAEVDLKRLETILDKRNKIAEEYFNNIGEELNSLNDCLFRDIYSIDEIVNQITLKFENILDIGCGTGRNLPILSKKATKVFGVDLSPKMLQLSEHICKKYKLNYELKIGDIYNLPFSDYFFDCVFINMVLHHISDPMKAFKEIARIIKKNGKMIFIDLLGHNNDEMRSKYADLWLGFTLDELENYFSKNGFTIEQKVIKEDKKNNLNGVIILILNKI
ncbi:MAG TPA: metalloregulator ArsR/SmtB family transcription factor [Spirochaetota bacterium]|nr:metalloregulator ArsR/SmtB family transcription factor [Spirochaetota bacterium]